MDSVFIVQKNRGVIFCADRLINVIIRRKHFSSKRLQRFGRFLANRMEGFEIGIHFFDTQTSDKSKQVQPVRADVADGAQCASEIWFEPPVPIGGEEQPILEIRTLHDEDVTQLTT